MVLLVSNPPHGDVDLEAAAPLLDLTVADTRLKMGYPVPEIWLNPSEPDGPAVARRLQDTGVHVVLVPGAAIAAIPTRRALEEFVFEAEGLRLHNDGDDALLLPYDAELVAVAFTPRQGIEREPPPAFMDLYALAEGGLRRWTVVRGATAFGGIGPRRTASFGTNVQVLTDELEQHFPRVTVDRRLMNMQVRRRVGAPPPGMKRQGFSYATAALNELLDQIRPGLSALDHDELASRLAFLTHAAT